MRKSVILIVLFSISTLLLRAQNVAGTAANASEVVKNIKSGKAYLVDVRTPDEFHGGHLLYAQNINYSSPDFKAQISKLNKKKPVYLYCRSGNRRGKAADTLEALGFTTFYNIGGFENLKVEGFPVANDSNPQIRSVSVQ